MRRGWLWLIAAMLVLAQPVRAAEPWLAVPEPKPLPTHLKAGTVEHVGARIWYATVGKGSPVILLHGGDASSDIWGDQVEALVAAHHRVILIDSRGHGRSTWDGSPLHYETMADDVVAVMDALHLSKASVVGWSDGAIISLILAMNDPERVSRVYAFAANTDLLGLNVEGAFAPTIGPSMELLKRIYQRVSPTPSKWGELSGAVLKMQLSEPDYSADELGALEGPKVAIVDGEHEEFITRAHTEYLARTIPGAELIILTGVSHFAPLQDPDGFNASMLKFLSGR